MIRHRPPIPVDTTTTADWWISLLSGTIAALLTGTVLYLIFLGTRKADRDRARTERTATSVANVVDASSGFTMAAKGWEAHQQATFDAQKLFSHSLLELAAREFQDHPEVARWAIMRASDIGGESSPILHAKDEDSWETANATHDPAHLATRISGALMRWLRDGTGKRFDPELPENIWEI